MGGPMGHKPIDVNTGLDTETTDAYKKVSTILGMLMQNSQQIQNAPGSELTKVSEYTANKTELTRLLENKRIV